MTGIDRPPNEVSLMKTMRTVVTAGVVALALVFPLASTAGAAPNAGPPDASAGSVAAGSVKPSVKVSPARLKACVAAKVKAGKKARKPVSKTVAARLCRAALTKPKASSASVSPAVSKVKYVKCASTAAGAKVLGVPRCKPGESPLRPGQPGASCSESKAVAVKYGIPQCGSPRQPADEAGGSSGESPTGPNASSASTPAKTDPTAPIAWNGRPYAALINDIRNNIAVSAAEWDYVNAEDARLWAVVEKVNDYTKGSPALEAAAMFGRAASERDNMLELPYAAFYHEVYKLSHPEWDPMDDPIRPSMWFSAYKAALTAPFRNQPGEVRYSAGCKDGVVAGTPWPAVIGGVNMYAIPLYESDYITY